MKREVNTLPDAPCQAAMCVIRSGAFDITNAMGSAAS